MAQVMVLPTPLAEPSEDRSVPVNKDQPECPSSDKSQGLPPLFSQCGNLNFFEVFDEHQDKTCP